VIQHTVVWTWLGEPQHVAAPIQAAPAPNGAAPEAAGTGTCVECAAEFPLSRRGGSPKRYCGAVCRLKAAARRKAHAAAAPAVAPKAVQQDAAPPAVAPEPAAEIERPFRTPGYPEDPSKAALLASVSVLPWETASARES
jgi:hypothetical protein